MDFKTPSWFILIIIGSVFLVRDIYPDLAIRRYIWPAALIAVGAFLILKPRRSHQWRCRKIKKKTATSNSGIEEATVVDEDL